MLESKSKSVGIQFKNLSYSVYVRKSKSKKKILNNINGHFKQGNLSAIMGPSGAGKTSLMHILTGFVKQGVRGDIAFDEDTKQRKKSTSYVLQDDTFFPWFTVDEVMQLAAALKISKKSLSTEERKDLIKEILQSLGLLLCSNTACGNLSGGQKKRLSIGLELLDNPKLIFLDEPTTGLDSSSSIDIVQLLKDLTLAGRTIVCTIHQPSAFIYFLFDNVYVLDRGYCVYQGSPNNTIHFLESLGVQCPAFHNPADVLLEVTTGEHGNRTAAMIEAAQNTKWQSASLSTDKSLLLYNDYDQIKMDIKQHRWIYPPNELTRLWLLVGRCQVQLYRDWTVTHLKLMLHILCAITVGLLFGDCGTRATRILSNILLCFISIFYLWYTSAIPAIVKFPIEIDTIRKEVFNKWYQTKTFYIASLISTIPIHILFALIFTTMIYLLTSQPWEIDRYTKYVFVHIVVSMMAEAFGVLIGTLTNPVNGTFLGAIISCFMVLFAGIFIFFSHMTVAMKAISYASPLRYAFECIIWAMYCNNREDLICKDEEIYCHFKKPILILDTIGIASDKSFGLNILIMFAQLIVFRGLAYFGLKRALKRARI